MDEADIVLPRLTAPVGGGNHARLREIAGLFLRLGCTAFGGPAAHVAVMEDEVVTRRGWLTRAAFLDQQALVQVLPGPNSTELAIHLGHWRGGWAGGLLAGLCFVTPSVLLVWGLAMLLAQGTLAPVIRGVLWWLAPVVVVIIADALWRFGRQAFARQTAPVVMPLTALAAILLPSDLVVLLVGAAGAVAVGRLGGGFGAAGSAASLVLGAAGLGAQALTSSRPPSGDLLLYFLRAGVSVFGSGYVLLAYLQRDLVEGRGWLTMPALLDAAALAQVTPGPLFSTATAAGYLIGGHPGALAATLGIFAPAFASVAVGAPLRRMVDRSAVTRLALDGVVIASVALLGRALIGFALPLQGWQWALALVAAVLLFGVRLQATRLLVLAVVLGLVGAGLHFVSS